MTSEPDPIPTRLRPRLTAPASGPTRAELPLSPAASAGLGRVSGGRPLEELVVLTAAAALVVAAAEATETPGLLVVGPEGPVTCQLDLAARESAGALVRATDAALRRAPAARGDRVGLTVRSTRIGPKDPATLELTLDGGVLRLRDAEGAHEEWFLGVLARAVDTALADFADPAGPPGGIRRAAPDDIAAALRLGTTGYVAEAADGTLLAPVEAVVRDAPDRPAVVAGNDTLTYGQLWHAAGLVAARLLALGTRPGDRIGVLTGKSIEALPALLGVLRARAAYVPLDPRAPGRRLTDQVRDAGCRTVLTTGDLAGRLPGVAVTEVAEALRTEPARSLPAPRPDDLAYVIYTSGSTGTPKGVRVTHRASASYVRWKVGHHAIDSDSRVLQIPSLAFDSSVSDIFPALAGGALLVLVDAHRALPRDLAGTAREHAVTHATILPSLYRLLLPELAGTTLRLVTVAGEATPADLVARHHAELPRVRLVNEYGPTENSVCATAFDHGPDAGPGLPVGRPIANTVVRVAAPDAGPLPPGFVGEVLLAGRGLADGYHARPELTAAAFLPSKEAPGGRWYRTGDLGWWRPDGVLEFCGRADGQVKIRGHRVEIGEVEHVLTGLDGVEAAAVVAVADPGADTALVAFVETSRGAESVARALTDRLPPAMLPAHLVPLPAIPRLVSGKPDGPRLAELARTELARAEGGPAPGGDPLVATIGEIFRSVLGGGPFGPDDDFFLRGGHSLAAIAVIGRVEDRLGVLLDLGDFLDLGTAREVADLVRAAGPASAPGPTTGDDQALWRLLDGDADSHG
ncbi:non-ribosomal peptide synthetase [Streptomyces sp. NBRC 109706]|uniref:non-ribosomal peptide synthetase n=1 Tax=Streptomyces sp. NBRC 109706 TaxID=1550035 RepID=UPI0007864937|nr:non-ribosomal peptide synthetase [Streptomyces sp. NBRC 109706]